MPRRPDAPSRMEILVLSSLARIPMHGYDLKLELRYKHVRWWAKAEHGHLYAVLLRLQRKKLIRAVRAAKSEKSKGRERRVFTLTPAGRSYLKRHLLELSSAPDQTYFDIDLFISSSFTLERDEAIEVLAQRIEVLARQHTEAEHLLETMRGRVPAAGKLIMEHRIAHLAREIEFTRDAIKAFRAQSSWGPMMGEESVRDFVKRLGVELEP